MKVDTKRLLSFFMLILIFNGLPNLYKYVIIDKITFMVFTYISQSFY